MARATASSSGKPGSWKNYYRGSFSTDALPAGFDKSKISNYLKTPGGEADCLVSDGTNDNVNWFQLARVTGTPYFLGVEANSRGNESSKVGLRISKDLVTWSSLLPVSTTNDSWATNWFAYPTFYRKDGGSNKDIDSEEFYLVGNHPNGNYQLNKLKLSILVPPWELANKKKLNTSSFTLSWPKVPNAASYSIRVDDISNSFGSDCSKPNPGDFCINTVSANSIDLNLTPGKSYRWWVHPRDSAGTWGPSSEIKTYTIYQGDINNDGVINRSDINLVISQFNKTGSADVNKDGKVNLYDYNIVVKNYRRTN